jgi:TolA-binding protein
MLTILGAAALASAAPATATPPDPCAGQSGCKQATAAQMFVLADRLFAEGNVAGAEQVLVALTQDPHPELRAEARFRLAALREKRGDLAGAVTALRDLLAEQPKANRARLELSRILAEQGHTGSAQRELERAQASGLPADVARTVSRFASLLSATKRRGASI